MLWTRNTFTPEEQGALVNTHLVLPVEWDAFPRRGLLSHAMSYQDPQVWAELLNQGVVHKVFLLSWHRNYLHRRAPYTIHVSFIWSDHWIIFGSSKMFIKLCTTKMDNICYCFSCELFYMTFLCVKFIILSCF